MLTKGQGIIQRLLKIGITDELSFAEKLRVELVNQFVLISAPILTLNLIINLSTNGTIADLMITIIWFGIVLLTLILNHHKYHFIAKAMNIIFGLVLITVVFLSYGLALQPEPFYLLLLIASVYFFNVKVSKYFLMIVSACYILAFLNIKYNGPILDEDISPFGPLLYFIFSATSILATSFKVLNENQKFNILHQEQNTLLEAQNKKLENNNEELERFAYVAAHDLKTPLRNISSYLGLIEMKNDKSNTKINEYLSITKGSVNKLHSLVGDILNYSRLEHDNLNMKPIDLNEIISQIIIDLKVLPDQNQTEFTVEELPYIRGNSAQVTLLFQNLIDNGIQYNQSKKKIISIDSRSTASNFIISVTDNGIGIEALYQDKIFKMFERLHSYDHYKGSGLGLAICKKIIEKHQGHITVNSSLGKGSTFEIHFPRLIR